MIGNIELFVEKMKKAELNQIVIDTFKEYYEKLVKGESGKLTKQDICPPEENNVLAYNMLNNSNPESLKKLAVIKLNGGLGTSMGLKKAKSLLPVKENLNFLDIISQQILHLRNKYHYQIPLLFMNSFNTQKDTLDSLKKYPNLAQGDLSLDFVQNKFPKIQQTDYLPLETNDDTLNWNPPGHGDLYACLASENTIDKLLNCGIEYLFVSNSDNLGATVDLKILNYMIDDQIPFLMEVCQRTEMDKKGGHLAQDLNAKLVLRESAQCPDNEIAEFQDIEKYRFFNTNNLWIDLKALKNYFITHNNIISLPLIINPKMVHNIPVYQLETAMGSAINLFVGAKAICVKRNRFLPVKKTPDLLLIWSDIYQLKQDFCLEALDNEEHILDLDPEFYGNIDDLTERVGTYVPSLKNCSFLQVIGDVSFGEDVVFKGKIILKTAKKLRLEKLELAN